MDSARSGETRLFGTRWTRADIRRPPSTTFTTLAIGNAALLLWAFSEPGGAFLPLLGSLCLWLVLGAWWAIRALLLAQSILTSRENAYEFPHDWRGWLWGPAVVAVVIALLLVRAPLLLRFGLSRSAFERVASDRSSIHRAMQGTWIGLYPVHRVWHEDGRVYFTTGGFLFDEDGFVYAPDGPPPNAWPMSTYPLGGTWHAFHRAD